MPAPSIPTTLPSLEGRSASDSDRASAWVVTILHSPDHTRVAERIPLGANLLFGRSGGTESEVALDDPKLSRHHARILRAADIVEIQDQGSRNGTFVNGARVDSCMLQAGDIVRIGDSILALQLAGTIPPRAGGDPSLVGTAPAFLAAVELADRVAASDLAVLILGETGTGKELLAHHIHARSGRTGAFVAVNCAALPEELVEATFFGHKKGAFTGATTDNPGLFLEAQGGTLFLDEISELDVTRQAKLLRALDSREIIPVGGTRPVHTDARVISATNVDLLAEIEGGGFRADLYARLAGAVVNLPPLRARRGDILDLAARFLAQPDEPAPAVERRLSAQAAERLLLHPWPRNVRELLSAMRRLRLGDAAEIRRVDVDAVLETPAGASSTSTGDRPKPHAGARPTREELTLQLTELRGNITRIAQHFDRDAKQVYRWLKHYGLDPDRYR